VKQTLGEGNRRPPETAHTASESLGKGFGVSTANRGLYGEFSAGPALALSDVGAGRPTMARHAHILPKWTILDIATKAVAAIECQGYRRPIAEVAGTGIAVLLPASAPSSSDGSALTTCPSGLEVPARRLRGTSVNTPSWVRSGVGLILVAGNAPLCGLRPGDGTLRRLPRGGVAMSQRGVLTRPEEGALSPVGI